MSEDEKELSPPDSYVPNVYEIVEQWLIDHGYDGLWCEDCACLTGDLFPCCGPYDRCTPGYRTSCTPECGEDHEYHVGPVKENK